MKKQYIFPFNNFSWREGGRTRNLWVGSRVFKQNPLALYVVAHENFGRLSSASFRRIHTTQSVTQLMLFEFIKVHLISRCSYVPTFSTVCTAFWKHVSALWGRRIISALRAAKRPFEGRVPVSRVHVHCSGLFLPRDAAEKIWSFLPGTGFQKRHFCFNVWRAQCNKGLSPLLVKNELWLLAYIIKYFALD